MATGKSIELQEGFVRDRSSEGGHWGFVPAEVSNKVPCALQGTVRSSSDPTDTINEESSERLLSAEPPRLRRAVLAQTHRLVKVCALRCSVSLQTKAWSVAPR